MVNLITGKDLSVKQRLMTLGAAAVLGIGSMLAVGWYQNARISTAIHDSIEIKNEVERINEMRLANANMVLAAMDTIIDRGEGSIQPERMDIINAAVTLLREGTPVLASVAAEAGSPGEVESYEADLNAVAQAIQVDLKRMVETGAPEQDYAAIDDAIDGSGERLGGVLNNL